MSWAAARFSSTLAETMRTLLLRKGTGRAGATLAACLKFDVDFLFDFNRDARVNVFDMLIARNDRTHFFNALNQ